MTKDIASGMDKLYESYRSAEISLKEFQFQLEPLMGSFNDVTKDDLDEIRRLINRLEVIIYTIPESDQRKEVSKMLPEVHVFFERKVLR